MSFLDTPEERSDFIADIITAFLDDVVNDIADMTSQESGWAYNMILRFDVRHVISTPQNFLRYGHRREKIPEYHPKLRNLFRRNIYDSRLFLDTNYDIMNLCIPASIMLALHLKLGTSLNRLNNRRFHKDLECLEFQGLLEIHKIGISLEQMNGFEDSHSPITPT